MLRLSLLAFVGLALFAPVAHAGWRIDRSLAIAQAVWHPTCGQLTLGYGDPADAGGDASGWAWAGDCKIRIPNGSHYEFEELCAIVLHEGGHVTGLGHSSNPRSAMYGEALVIKTTAVIGRRTITRWTGVDHRCLNRGRPYLESRGLL